jgi:L-ascorbate metabolism protein UlaG (beta-lactamase superfamily)
LPRLFGEPLARHQLRAQVAPIAIPMHYKTFPILDQDASKFTPSGIEVMEIEPGSSIEM